MLHNNISNRVAGTVAFRVDNCLLKYKKNEGFLTKTLNVLRGKKWSADIDPEMLNRVNYVYKRTDYLVALVVSEEYEKGLEEFLMKNNIPYSELLVDKFNYFHHLDINLKLNSGNYIYYVDSDKHRLNALDNKNGITPEIFDIIFRGR